MRGGRKKLISLNHSNCKMLYVYPMATTEEKPLINT
jgi:hypothetical protein